MRLAVPKRVFVAVAFLAIGASAFWSSSRYPALRDKQQMGDRVSIGEVLSHDALVAVDPESSFPVRSAITAVNWLHTNRIGMAFGIFFGAGVLTLLAFLSLASRRRPPWLDSILGMAIGAPLGVCVNCATPIGRGMRAAGLPPAMYLATMHSSPTLNVVVLTMLWGLFPLEFFVVKVGATLLFVLVLVPFLARLVPASGGVPEPETPVVLPAVGADEPWHRAILETGQAFGRSLWYVVKLTVPLMLLAGVLGAVMAEAVPASIFVGTEATVAVLVGAALLGTLLPVPMAFDVILAFVLWRAGMPESLTMVFLFTLGILSVFPLSIVWRQISRPLAAAQLATVVCLGLGSGVALETYRGHTLASSLALFDANIAEPTIEGVVGGLCRRYRGAEDRDRCRTALLSMVAAEAPDEAVCSELGGGEVERDCRSQVRVRDAARGGAIEPCRALDGSRRQMECVEAVVSAHVERGGDASLCPELRDESKIRQCHLAAAVSQAEREDDPAPCLALGEAEQRACLARLVAARLDRGGGLESCTLFGDADVRVSCERAVAEHLARVRDDLSTCGNIAQPVSRRRCERQVVEGKLAHGANESLCAALSREDDRAACRKQVVLARIRRGEPSDTCQALEGRRNVESCWRLAASVDTDRQRGLALCARIDDADLARRCRDEVRVGAALDAADPEPCEAVEAPELRDACVAHAVTAAALGRGKLALCEDIGASDGVHACRTAVAGDLASRRADPRGCYQLPAGAARSDCKLAALTAMQREVALHLAAAIGDVGAELLESAAAGVDPPARASDRPGLPAPHIEWRVDREDREARIESAAFAPRRGQAGAMFTALDARAVGIDLGNDTTLLDYVEPHCHGRGLAAGDVDGDGWTDLAFATREGARLYRGVGPEGFVEAPLPQRSIADKDVLVVALVDVDSDGFQDLFAASVASGIYFLRNVEGSFADQRIAHVRDAGAEVVRTAAFGDVDRDGRLDFVVGNWAPGAPSANKLYLNRGQRFEPVPLEAAGPALTLATLLSDVDDDGWLDLFVGNDFEPPDRFYRGSPEGLVEVSPGTGAVPFTAIHTMSLDSADVDNDLTLDLFATDLPYAGEVREADCAGLEHEEDRARCARNRRMERAIRLNDLDGCMDEPAEADRRRCLVGGVLYLATSTRRPALCERVPGDLSGLRSLCDLLASSPIRSAEANRRLSLPRGDGFPQHQANVLLLGRGDATFTEGAEAWGVAKTSWSWSGKLADVDQDGYQDLYVANGVGGFAVPQNAFYPSYFFRNVRGQRFVLDHGAGLDDPFHASSFVWLDWDGDGDLDVIARGFNAPVRVFRNDGTGARSLVVELRDERGNAFGIGSRVTLRLDDGSQVREIKAGGGYMAFDAPVAHFGVGAARRARRIEVRWSTGEEQTYEGSFETGRRYRITRLSGR